MPYIRDEYREHLDPPLSALHPNNAGELNYCISRLCDQLLQDRGVNYNQLNEIIGVLECAKLEMYRRVATVYEDKKCSQNGDVYHV